MTYIKIDKFYYTRIWMFFYRHHWISYNSFKMREKYKFFDILVNSIYLQIGMKNSLKNRQVHLLIEMRGSPPGAYAPLTLHTLTTRRGLARNRCLTGLQSFLVGSTPLSLSEAGKRSEELAISHQPSSCSSYSSSYSFILFVASCSIHDIIHFDIETDKRNQLLRVAFQLKFQQEIISISIVCQVPEKIIIIIE